MQHVGPMGWGCCRLIHSDFAGAELTFAVSPLLPFSQLVPFFHPLPLFPLSHLCVRHPFCLSPLLPPCSMGRQVGSATLGCRAALTASTATACLRARGPGNRLQMSAKLFTIWTGFSRVSLWQTSMKALEVFAPRDVYSCFGVCLTACPLL